MWSGFGGVGGGGKGLRCYRIILNCVKGAENREIVADRAKFFFDAAMNSIEEAESLQFLSAIIGKKDVLHLDAASICELIGRLNSVDEPICVAILNGLLKHYTKNVYGCVSLWLAVVRTRFLGLLSWGEGGGGEEVEDMSSERGKIENMSGEINALFQSLNGHTEIFKKHIIGLVIDYVDARGKGDMSELVKSQINVNFLLELVSKYEEAQIYCLLSVGGADSKKFLFRELWKTFQHSVYRGAA